MTIANPPPSDPVRINDAPPWGCVWWWWIIAILIIVLMLWAGQLYWRGSRPAPAIPPPTAPPVNPTPVTPPPTPRAMFGV